MAKYKNREVLIIKELPNSQGDMVQIEHLEPGVSGSEIVPKAQVWVSDEEKKAQDKLRDQGKSDNDYKVIGKDDETLPVMAPSATEVKVQRMAEDNLERAEKQAKDNADWQKKHPALPVTAKTQLDNIKVVPYKDEAPSKSFKDTPASKSEVQRSVEARDAANKNKVTK